MDLISVSLDDDSVDSEYRCVFLTLALSAKVPISVSENIIGPGLQCLIVSRSPAHPSRGCFGSQCTRHYSRTIPNDSREFVPQVSASTALCTLFLLCCKAVLGSLGCFVLPKT